MDNQTADLPVSRFLTYWGAYFTTFMFGVLALVMIGITGKAARARVNPDDVRRQKMDSESIAAQQKAVSSWKKNDDGTYEVPPEVALPKMVNKLSPPAKSEVPVPGTKAAEAAAAAATPPPAAPAVAQPPK